MKMNPFRIIGLILSCAFLIGCKSVSPVWDDTTSIVLKRPQHRSIMMGSVDFPAGVYAPDFQTDKGTYYLAPTKLVVSGLGMRRPKRGGLFVPFDKSNGKQGMWLDQEEGSGGLIIAGATSTTRLWKFDEPILFETQKLEAQP